MSLADWLPAATVGTAFTAMGLIKLVGLRLGIVGGGGKPLATRLCGT
jgi:hypothetical protein